MNKQSRLHAGRRYLSEYCGAAIAAGLIFGGTYQVLNNLKEPIAIGIILLINAIIRTGFRGVPQLPDYAGMPWLLFVRFAAVGFVVMTVGILVGLWVNMQSQRQPPDSEANI